MTTWLGTRVRSPICAGWQDSPLALAGPAVFGVPSTPFSMPRPFFNIKTVTFWVQMPQCWPHVLLDVTTASLWAQMPQCRLPPFLNVATVPLWGQMP